MDLENNSKHKIKELWKIWTKNKIKAKILLWNFELNDRQKQIIKLDNEFIKYQQVNYFLGSTFTNNINGLDEIQDYYFQATKFLNYIVKEKYNNQIIELIDEYNKISPDKETDKALFSLPKNFTFEHLYKSYNTIMDTLLDDFINNNNYQYFDRVKKIDDITYYFFNTKMDKKDIGLINSWSKRDFDFREKIGRVAYLMKDSIHKYRNLEKKEIEYRFDFFIYITKKIKSNKD